MNLATEKNIWILHICVSSFVHVVTVGAGGTHSVSVFIFHYNVKLMLSAIEVVNKKIIFLWIKSFFSQH